jgi:class 3 adenylate cyclase/tetratricopeptide (TPR) repeat protein
MPSQAAEVKKSDPTKTPMSCPMAYHARVDCAGCQHENPPESRFCESCGAELAAACAQCGASLSPAARFCNQCGTPRDVQAPAPRAATPPTPGRGAPRDYTPRHLADRILTSRSALEGERKQVTVLFADVKGSMALASDLDPEEWHAILDRFFEILAQGIHRFEGTVNQYTGDGVMALFGAPLAHEDHAQRACYAALHLQEALRGYADELRRDGLNLSVRIGLNSGEVVVGKIGDDLRMDYTAQGFTVGLAQRAEELAEAGRVLVTEHTARLVEGYFQLRSLGISRLRGVPDPVELLELEGLGALRTRLDASRASGYTRFVGREAELDQLEAALGRAMTGDAGVVGVVGEAGVGKSRLCETFVERARAKGIAVYQGHCPSHGRGLSSIAALEIARSFFDVEAREDPDEARRKIAGTLVLLDEGLRSELPLLFEFLGYRDPNATPDRSDAAARRRRLIAFLGELTRARSAKQVAIIFVDDLHWVDPESDDFIADLIAAAAGTRTLVLANFRPEYDAPWMTGARYQQLALRPLGRPESEALLDSLLGSDASLEPARERILDRAGGNPFFTEELAKGLVESGVLDGAPGAYHLSAGLPDAIVPESVQALLSARIDRLDERDKTLLQTAAVIGRDFSWGVLSRVAELPEAALREALDTLVRGEFVHETELYPEPAYRFKHALTQNVAYDEQLRDRRRQVHRGVARALEEVHADRLDEHGGEIAAHLEQAGDRFEAAQSFASAGDHAGIRFADAAARYWSRVIDLTEDASTREAKLLRLRACVSRILRGWTVPLEREDSERLLREGRVLGEELDERIWLMRLESSYALLMLRRDTNAQFAHLERALALVDGETPVAERISLHQRFSWTHSLWGDIRVALEHAELGLALSVGGPAADSCLLGYNSFVATDATRVLALCLIGRHREARDSVSTLLATARDHGDPLSTMLAYLTAARVATVDGDLAEAERFYLESIKTIGLLDARFSIPATGALADLRMERGDWKGAAEIARVALEIEERLLPVDRMPGAYWELALARANLRIEPGEASRARAESLLDASEAITPYAEDRLVRAALRGDLGGAEAKGQILKEIDAAAENLASRGIVGFDRDVQMARAELARLLGDEAGRIEHLRAARSCVAALGAEKWVARLDAELESGDVG